MRKTKIGSRSLQIADETAVNRDLPRANHRGLQRSSEILTCAMEMFLERGFDPVSINDVVAQVGGSKTNVYSYYGDKIGLFRAAITALTEEMLAPLHALAIKDLPLEKGLQQIATKILEILLRKRHLEYQRLIFAEAPRHPEIGTMWFQNGPDITRALIADYLRRQQIAGRVSAKVHVEEAAQLFHDMVVWTPLLRTMFGQGEESAGGTQSHSDGAVKLFVAAIQD